MLTVILGTPGSGKSYEAVAEHILPAVRDGRKVITNMPLNIEHFRGLIPHAPDLIDVRTGTAENPIPFKRRHDYETDWKHPEKKIGPLFVIDEAHLPLPPKETDKDVEAWFALHRHTGSDVILITQSWQSISANIRRLCEFCVKLRKNRALGSSKSYSKVIRAGYDRGPEISPIQLKRYQPQYFPFYQSYTMGGAAEATGNSPTVWKHWSFKASAAMVLLALYILGRNDFTIFPKAEASNKAIEASQGVSATPTAVASLPAAYAPSLVAPQAPKDPFHDLGFFIGGRLTIGEKSVPMIYAGGRHIFSRLRLETLIEAGYRVKVVDSCLIRLSYGAGAQLITRYVTCQKPQRAPQDSPDLDEPTPDASPIISLG